MQYINHKTQTIYSGDKAHWRDIETTSEQPSPHHKPVVEDGKHTGWELDQDAVNAARIEELKQKLTETDHKALSDYEPKEGEGSEAVYAQRKAWRDEIRSLQA